MTETRREHTGREAEMVALVCKWQDEQDVAARDRVVLAHLGVVHNIVRKYKGTAASPEDAIAEGTLGLFDAVNKFDRTKGTTFGSYAQLWVRARVLTFLRESRLLHDNSKAARKAWFGVGRAQRALEAAGKPVNAATIAEHLGIPAAKVHQVEGLLASMQPMKLLDAPARVAEDDGSSLHDRLASDALGPDELYDAAAEAFYQEKRLELARAELTERERTVLDLSYPADGSEPRSLREIGSVLGKSGERVRQIKAGAERRLRALVRRPMTHREVHMEAEYAEQIERARALLVEHMPGPGRAPHPALVALVVKLASIRTAREVARTLGIATSTVTRWQRYAEQPVPMPDRRYGNDGYMSRKKKTKEQEPMNPDKISSAAPTPSPAQELAQEPARPHTRLRAPLPAWPRVEHVVDEDPEITAIAACAAALAKLSDKSTIDRVLTYLDDRFGSRPREATVQVRL